MEFKLDKQGQETTRVYYYVAECMEFPNYGAIYSRITSLKKAVEIYQAIPKEQLNMGRGIGLMVYDPMYSEEYQTFDVVLGGEIDMDMLQKMYRFEKYPVIINAVKELTELMPEIRIIDTHGLLKNGIVNDKNSGTVEEMLADYHWNAGEISEDKKSR